MSRLLSFILALSLGLSTHSSAEPKAQRIKLFYGIAEGNYLIGDLQGAASGIEEMLKIDPDYLPALTLKARVKLDQNDTLTALTAVDQALALAPNNFEFQLLKALVLGNLDRKDAATTLINQVMATADPASDDARAANRLLGLLNMAAGDWDAAAQAFNQIYLNNPESAISSLQLASEAYLEKARNALNQSKTGEAIAAINQALALYEGKSGQEALRQRTALRMMRARAFTQLGDFDTAIDDLQTLTGQQPDNLEALVTLASLYASTERWPSARA
jgi:predicted Zn-dependent protease